MANLLPRIPVLSDIAGMQMTQLQAYCRVWELPTGNLKIDDLRGMLNTLRLMMQGDPHVVTPADARTLFDAWGLQGDYETTLPDSLIVVLLGHAAALGMRANAIGYCRNPLSVTAKNPSTRFTGTGECDITMTIDANPPSQSNGKGVCDITVTVDSAV
jgi:hypothetical protein